MKAVVMAGGSGSRLRPLTIGRPKPMVPLANQSVLAHILDLLRDAGITEVVMTLQYMASMIRDYFGDGSSLGMQIHYVVEDVPLGTAGSVRNASRYLDDTFLVISGDAVTDFDLRKIIDHHRERQALATLVLYGVADPLDYGVIVTDGQGRIVRFQEKPDWGELASDTVNTGIYVLEPEVLEMVPAGQPYDWALQVFPALLQKEAAMVGYVAAGYWCDIGTLSEYQRATADFLSGKVRWTFPPGQHIGGDIWIGEDVRIAPGAQLFGPIYLGDEVRVESGAVIRGPSVVRDNTVIDKRALIDRTIVWRNCYIGEGAELRGAIISRQCSVRSHAALFEGTVVGDNSIVGEGASLHPGVKLWPNKSVDRGAVVKNSIIWGSQGRRVLFGRHGVTGVVNVDLTPEFAARLGAAFGATLPRKSLVTINRDAHPGSRMLKRAVISGLPSAGLDVRDLQNVPIPVARFYTRTKEAVGGVHVRISPFDPSVVDIRFFGSDGLNLSKNDERQVERVFFREDFRRAYMNEVGSIDYAPDVIQHYMQSFLRAVDGEAIRQANFNLVVDYAFASTSLVLPEILRTLGVNTTPLGARLDTTYISLPPEAFEKEQRVMATIVKALGCEMGVRLDVGGEKITLADDRGRLVPSPVMCAAMVELALRTAPGGTVVAPVNLSSVLERIADHYGGHVRRTAADQASLMQAASQPGAILAADGSGVFIFPDFHPGPDAMIATARLLQYLAVHKVHLSEIIADLPDFFVVSASVGCPWEAKGGVMRLLHEHFAHSQTELIDGVKVFFSPHEWVLMRPDPDRPLLHVTAESQTTERAQSLVAEHSRLVTALIQEAEQGEET